MLLQANTCLHPSGTICGQISNFTHIFNTGQLAAPWTSRKSPLPSALQHLHHVPEHLPLSQLQLEADVQQGGAVVARSLRGSPALVSRQPGARGTDTPDPGACPPTPYPHQQMATPLLMNLVLDRPLPTLATVQRVSHRCLLTAETPQGLSQPPGVAPPDTASCRRFDRSTSPTGMSRSLGSRLSGSRCLPVGGRVLPSGPTEDQGLLRCGRPVPTGVPQQESAVPLCFGALSPLTIASPGL